MSSRDVKRCRDRAEELRTTSVLMTSQDCLRIRRELGHDRRHDRLGVIADIGQTERHGPAHPHLHERRVQDIGHMGKTSRTGPHRRQLHIA